MMLKALPLAHLRQQMIISVKKQKTRSSNQLKIDRFLAKLPRKFISAKLAPKISDQPITP